MHCSNTCFKSSVNACHLAPHALASSAKLISARRLCQLLISKDQNTLPRSHTYQDWPPWFWVFVPRRKKETPSAPSLDLFSFSFSFSFFFFFSWCWSWVLLMMAPARLYQRRTDINITLPKMQLCNCKRTVLLRCYLKHSLHRCHCCWQHHCHCVPVIFCLSDKACKKQLLVKYVHRQLRLLRYHLYLYQKRQPELPAQVLMDN